MFDFAATLDRIRAQALGATLLVAAPYDLPVQLRDDLIARGLAKAFVLDEPPPADAAPSSRVGGWWTDLDRRTWWLAPSTGATLVLIGAREGDHLDGRMLFEAWNKGYARIRLFDFLACPVGDIDVSAAIVARLGTSDQGSAYGELRYDQAIDAIFDAMGDQLRLPTSEFVPGRILLLTGSLQPGGSERQLAYTAEGLARRGFDVVVGCNYLDPPRDFFQAAIEEAGVRVELVPSRHGSFDSDEVLRMRQNLQSYDALRVNWGLLHEIWHYALLIRQIKPQLVHTWMDYTNVLAGMAAEFVGVPSLVQGGRSLAPWHFPQLFQPYMRPGYRAVTARRQVVAINNSAAGARDYETWLGLPEASIGVVHNGFVFPDASSDAGPEMRKRHGLPSEAVVVGAITRFTEEKNASLFVAAAIALHQRRPDVRFLVFGDGPELQPLRLRVAEAGLSDVIIMPGLTPSPWPALAAMDILVLTSRVEGLANVLVEAQAAEIPIVCTGVGGMRETFIEGVTGVSVPSATADAVADALQPLVDDQSLRRRMGRAGRDHVTLGFGLEAMIDNTLAAYGRAGFVGSKK